MAWSDAAREAAAQARRLHAFRNRPTPNNVGSAFAPTVAGHYPIEKIKKGEYVKRKPDSNTVYVKGHYDHASKSFSLSAAHDMNKEIFVKRGKKVFAGFTY